MSHRLTFRQYAGLCERFAPDAFAHAAGRAIQVTIAGVSYQGAVISAEVVDDGRAVLVTLDTDAPVCCVYAAPPPG